MPEKKVTVPFGASGRTAAGWEVAVDESTEKWSEYKLSDGTLVRGKLTIVSAVRIEGQYDPNGNPMYSLNMTPSIVIMSADERLRAKSKK
jgi:hypothetical protein